MEEFNYAHNNTSVSERLSRTANLNKLQVSEGVKKLREGAFEKSIPVASDETLGFVTTLALAKGAHNILEVGCAIGVTSRALLETCANAHITAIERDKNFYESAKVNLAPFEGRVKLIYGDALDVVQTLGEGEFDFIFLDCAKVQYIKLLPNLKKLLKVGGILLADDVLLYGWVNGEVPPPPKRKMLVQHIREYIDGVTGDESLSTSIVDVGDGLAFSVKKHD